MAKSTEILELKALAEYLCAVLSAPGALTGALDEVDVVATVRNMQLLVNAVDVRPRKIDDMRDFVFREGDRVIMHSLGSGYFANKELNGVIRGCSVFNGNDPSTVYIVESREFPGSKFTCFGIPQACLRRA